MNRDGSRVADIDDIFFPSWHSYLEKDRAQGTAGDETARARARARGKVRGGGDRVKRDALSDDTE